MREEDEHWVAAPKPALLTRRLARRSILAIGAVNKGYNKRPSRALGRVECLSPLVFAFLLISSSLTPSTATARAGELSPGRA